MECFRLLAPLSPAACSIPPFCHRLTDRFGRTDSVGDGHRLLEGPCFPLSLSRNYVAVLNRFASSG